MFDGNNWICTSSVSGKWSDVSDSGDIYYTGGKVGIGTTSPSTKFHVCQDRFCPEDSTRYNYSAHHSSLAFIRSSNNPDGDDLKPALEVANGGGSGYGIVSRATHNYFSGEVGIGTSVPDEALHVEGSLLVDAYNTTDPSSSGIFFREGFNESYPANDPQPYNASITLWDGSNDGASYDGLSINGHDGVVIRTNSNEVPNLIVPSNGNVGIGITNPSTKLEIAGKAGKVNEPQDGTEDIPILRLNDTVTDYGSGTATTGEVRGGIEFYSNESTRVSGTTTPYQGLSSAIYQVNESKYNTRHGLAMLTRGSTDLEPEEALRIDADGLVGVGTTDPSSTLHVHGEEIRSLNGLCDEAGQNCLTPRMMEHTQTFTDGIFIERFNIDGIEYMAIADDDSDQVVVHSRAPTETTWLYHHTIAAQYPRGMAYFSFNDKHRLAVAEAKSASGEYNIVSRVFEWDDWDGESDTPNTFQDPLDADEQVQTNGAFSWEHFIIDGSNYLAVANYNGDYAQGSTETRDYTADSVIYKWNAGGFNQMDNVTADGARAWRHLEYNGQHFLFLATNNEDAKLYSFDPTLDNPLAEVTVLSHQARDASFFEMDGITYLAVASTHYTTELYTFDGTSLTYVQSLRGNSHVTGITHFAIDGEEYLGFASYGLPDSAHIGPSKLFRWNGSKFIELQEFITSVGYDIFYDGIDTNGNDVSDEHQIIIAGSWATHIYRLTPDDTWVALTSQPGDEALSLRDGNIGIGTTSPSTKFHVCQDRFCPEDSTTYDYSAHHSSLAFIRSSNNPDGDDLKPALEVANGGGSGYGIVSRATHNYFSGEVGIGTTGPTTRLEVLSGTNTDENFNKALTVGTSTGGGQGGWIGSRTASANQNQGLMLSSSQTLTLHGDNAGDGSSVLDILGGSNPDIPGDTSLLMRVNSDGNVGIGITNPSTKLEIAGKAGKVNEPQDGTEDIPILRLNDTVTDYGSGTATTGEVRGGIEFYSNESTRVTGTTTPYQGLSSAIYQVNENKYNTSHGLALLTRRNNDTKPKEVVRISSAGNVGIGTTSPNTKFHVCQDGFCPENSTEAYDYSAHHSSLAFIRSSNNPDGDDLKPALEVANGGGSGYGIVSRAINNYFSGKITVNATTYESDSRLKTAVTTIPSALEKILSLRGVTFEWKTKEFPERNFTEGTQIGLIAQEVEEVFPELVSQGEYKSVSYANLVSPLIEAVKELHALYQGHADRLVALEAQNAEQDNHIAHQDERIAHQDELIVQLEVRLAALEAAQ